jgi:transposase
MRPPIYVRPLTETERQQVAAGLGSAQVFTLRRSQIVLASARGEPVPQIARELGCGDQTVRNALHAFNAQGVAALRPGSTRPHTLHAVVTPDRAERLRALLHHSPRSFGQSTSVWTLDLAAQVSFEQGLLPARVSDETIRLALKRLGVGWKRAKRWITSPDPAYARKKAVATA